MKTWTVRRSGEKGRAPQGLEDLDGARHFADFVRAVLGGNVRGRVARGQLGHGLADQLERLAQPPAGEPHHHAQQHQQHDADDHGRGLGHVAGLGHGLVDGGGAVFAQLVDFPDQRVDALDGGGVVHDDGARDLVGALGLLDHLFGVLQGFDVSVDDVQDVAQRLAFGVVHAQRQVGIQRHADFADLAVELDDLLAVLDQQVILVLVQHAAEAQGLVDFVQVRAFARGAFLERRPGAARLLNLIQGDERTGDDGRRGQRKEHGNDRADGGDFK